ncbi:CBASS effector endonuclease NucC [Pseudomonas sp. Pseu.R1]|uniref:CBASS effector endonuclease NucC n=1 Tax=Pseudomonas sp. Pseu.R1 TaxID=3379818 RepID=UPI003B95E424
MSNWSLSILLASLHEDIQTRLGTARKAFSHPGAKGDASEGVWLDMLNTYLPKRYEAANAFVVDSLGNFSDQIDVVVFDRQYSPFIFKFDNQIIVPAESVYAVFEAKQTATAELVGYAQRKVTSVRKLHRTSLPIPHAGGTYPAKPLIPILGGLLTFESDWSPALGASFDKALKVDTDQGRLDLGCVASHGHFFYDGDGKAFKFETENKPATAFLFKLIALLQFSGTVPMIDIDAYGKWLAQ